MEEDAKIIVSITNYEERQERKDVITTTSGNRISRAAFLCGPQNIRLHGQTLVKDRATLRGDRAPISVGRFCVFGTRSVVRPAAVVLSGTSASSTEIYAPLAIGDYVEFGDRCVVEARKIGSFVTIGDDAVIGSGCIVKDCCRILPGAVLPPGMVVPPFSQVGGVPAQIDDSELPCDTAQITEEACMHAFNRFTLT